MWPFSLESWSVYVILNVICDSVVVEVREHFSAKMTSELELNLERGAGVSFCSSKTVFLGGNLPETVTPRNVLCYLSHTCA